MCDFEQDFLCSKNITETTDKTWRESNNQILEMYQCYFPGFDGCIMVMKETTLVCQKYQSIRTTAYSPMAQQKKLFVLYSKLSVSFRLFKNKRFKYIKWFFIYYAFGFLHQLFQKEIPQLFQTSEKRIHEEVK